MSTELSVEQEFPAAPSDVFSLFTDREFLQARMVAGGGIDPEVVSAPDDGATADSGAADGAGAGAAAGAGSAAADGGRTAATVVTRQAIPASVLPSMVASMIPGDPLTERTEHWREDGDGFVAEFSVVVKGAPASLKGTMTLCRAPVDADGAACTLQVEGQATVPIPMFGPKIEAVIVEQIGELLESEGNYTRERLGG